MGLHRLVRDHEVRRHLAVGRSGGYEVHDLELPPGQERELARAVGEQARLLLAERQRPVVAGFVAAQEEWRVSLALPTLARARSIDVLVGAAKAPIVERVLRGADSPLLPATEVLRAAEGAGCAVTVLLG